MGQSLCCNFQSESPQNTPYIKVPPLLEITPSKYGLVIDRLQDWMLHNYPDNNVRFKIFDLNTQTHRYNLWIQLHGTAMIISVNKVNTKSTYQAIITKSQNSSTILTVNDKGLKETIVCELYPTMVHKRKLFDFNNWDFSGWLSFAGQKPIPIAILLRNHTISYKNSKNTKYIKDCKWENFDRTMLVNP